eukprot:CAMPEP_0172815386 /NCGR_PEP_ID=MMETSP1075-20121228/11729_1 /TAXON_ID=2916 /ORGANISM="Ceratium fusus, Strain PA161109" /LENGTH=393 /DNA_ID=CAMNT_0013655223 /DNA_START=63 /DNA_END=1241 /DNA_ORIENTATION=+
MAFRIPGVLAILLCTTATLAETTEHVHSAMNADRVSHFEHSGQTEDELSTIQTDLHHVSHQVSSAQQVSSVEQLGGHKEATTEEVGLSVEAGQDLEHVQEMETKVLKEEMKTLEQEEEEDEDGDEDVLGEEDEDEDEEDAEEKDLEKAEEEERKADEGIEEEEVEDETAALDNQDRQVAGDLDDVTSALQATVSVNAGNRERGDAATTDDHHEEGGDTDDEDEEQAYQEEDEEADNLDALHEVEEGGRTFHTQSLVEDTDDGEEESDVPVVSMMSTGDSDEVSQEEHEWKQEITDEDNEKVEADEAHEAQTEDSAESQEDNEIPPEATPEELKKLPKEDVEVDMALVDTGKKSQETDSLDEDDQEASVVGSDPGIVKDILKSEGVDEDDLDEG